VSKPWVDREHPKSCSGWFAFDGTTGDHICDCGVSEETNSDGLMQHDLGLILTALGLGDHARPDTPHVVVHDVILPALRELKRSESIYAWPDMRKPSIVRPR
jgi:hypothetical protein